MTRVRRMLGAATCTALALLGTAAVAPAASAADGGVAHYSYDDVVSARKALSAADLGCDIVTIPVPPWVGIAACGNGIGDVRDGLDEAFFRHCGMDLHWTDDGPMSYDGTYRAVPCP
jgi:hypothetical protein